MESPSLAEVIKQYVYTRQLLLADPDNTDLLIRTVKLCLQAGLFRTARDISCRLFNAGIGEAKAFADEANKILESGIGRYCVVVSDLNGHVLVADGVANSITKFSRDGTAIWSVDKEGFEDDAVYRPDCSAVDGDGNLYVGSSGLSRIQVFDKNGVFRRVFAVPKRFGTRVRMQSISCDEYGNLWIIDSMHGNLMLVDPEGNDIGSIVLR